VRGQPMPRDAKIDFADLDEDGDGKVTLDEFLGYYRRVGLTPIGISGIKTQKDAADAASEMLFKILDKNGDGLLTKDELADAWTILNKYDANDDELITPMEILGVEVTTPQVEEVRRPPPDGEQPPEDRGFFVFGRDESPRGV